MSGQCRAHRPGEKLKYLIGALPRHALYEAVQHAWRGGAQQPAEAVRAEFSRGGRDENEALRLNRTLAGGTAEIGQGRHAAHGVPYQGERARHAKRYQQLGEIVGEAVDSVRIHRRIAGVAVATVVVTDDPDVAAPAMDQLRHLDVPGILVQAKAVKKYDCVASGVRSPVIDGQRDAIARGDCAVAGQRSACAGHSPIAASRWRRLRRHRVVTRHGSIWGARIPAKLSATGCAGCR